MLRRYYSSTSSKSLILPKFAAVSPFLNSTRLMNSSLSSSSQNKTSTIRNNNDDNDDDFVPDSIFLTNPTTTKDSTSSINISNNNNNNLPIPVEPLGIERLPNIPDGTRFSRLNNIVTSKPAPNVPTQRKASFEEPQMDEVTSMLAQEEAIQQMGREGIPYEDAEKLLRQQQQQRNHQKNASLNKSSSSNMDAESSKNNQQEGADDLEATEEEEFEEFTMNDENSNQLPYDDADFAETILKMEVEGALDETWQDTIQAKTEDVKEICDVLRDSRARDIAAIDVRSKTSSFDFIVVATCESQRHMTLVSWSVSEADKWNRLAKPQRRKADELWDIVPVGRILVNLMVESYRNEVTIERKWAVTKTMDPLDAAHTRVSESRQTRMHGLWTLTMNLQDLEDFEIDYCKDVLLSQL